MILDDTYRFLKEKYREKFEDLLIADLRIGLHLTAVKLSDGCCGVASTVQDTQHHCVKKNRDYGEFTPARIRGRRVTDLFETKKQSGIIDTLKIAVLNAFSSCLIPGGAYRIVEDADPIDLIDLTPVKTITIVGAFQSYIQRISGSGNRLFVLEFKEEALSGEHRKHYVPAHEFGRVIPESDIVIITGLTLVNNTIDGLLSTVAPGTQLIVTGPSSSLAPDILFRNHVSMVGATQITDPDLLFDIVSEAGAGFHLFNYCARKICILNPSGS